MAIPGAPPSYRESHSLEMRRSQAAAIRSKHPDRIPVIVEKRARDSTLPLIDKKKFLVPADLTVGQFVYVIRKRIALRPEQAIFLFVSKGTLPPTIASLQSIYDAHRDEDGFLYMTYSGENTFGTVENSGETAFRMAEQRMRRVDHFCSSGAPRRLSMLREHGVACQ